MTVIFYGEGDHPSGFIGYRVATTLGSNGSYNQQYFSCNTYSTEAAKIKADAKNKQWREHAAEYKKESMLDNLRADNYIAANFRAIIRRRKEKLKTGSACYVYPAFSVGVSGGNGINAKEFPIGKKHTFDEAFLLAVNAYCTMYGFDDKAKQVLLSRKPAKDLFTGYLYKESIANGLNVDLVDLCERLDKQKEGTQQ